MRTQKQLQHYLLSFADTLLYEWYNGVMVDPFGDYKEQTIHVNTENAQKTLKDVYSLEVLCEVMRNENTNFNEDDTYIAICGGDSPYIISFNSFEEFMANMSAEDRDGFLGYVQEFPEHLETLEEMNRERENK